MATLNRTKDNPWALKTPPGTSEYTMHIDEKDGVQVLLYVPPLMEELGLCDLEYNLKGNRMRAK